MVIWVGSDGTCRGPYAQVPGYASLPEIPIEMLCITYATDCCAALAANKPLLTCSQSRLSLLACHNTALRRSLATYMSQN